MLKICCHIVQVFISVLLGYTFATFTSLPFPLTSRAHFERSARHISNPKVHRCGEVGRDLVVNFVNTNYPNDDTITGDCKFRMVVTSQHTCQIRVDFVDTELMDPVRGECLSQFFIVEGAIWPTGLPPLCGINNDQHFYLHLEPWYGNATVVDFNLVTVVRGRPYRFGVWLTQIDCSSFNVLKAPEGCTQYYLAENGTIKSFNYEGYRYLNSQNYQICIRPTKGVCGVEYTAPVGDFAIKKSIVANKDVMQRSGSGSTICGTDYVFIPGGKETTSNVRRQRLLFNRRRRPAANRPPPPPQRKRLTVTASADRFCGSILSPITGEAVSKPIYARVRANMVFLRVKTTPLQEERGAIEALNLTSGFRIAYKLMKECDDNEVDLVSPQSVNTLLESILWGADGDVALRETTLKSGEIASVSESTRINGTDSVSVEQVADEEIWEYLEENTDDNVAEEKDLYDF